jgi:hypothetical protein
MNPALKAVLAYMLNHRCIGGKHKPEAELKRNKTRWLSKEERRDFEEEYRGAINNGLIIRVKKKTGKGDDWHISLEPSRLRELYEMIENG